MITDKVKCFSSKHLKSEQAGDQDLGLNTVRILEIPTSLLFLSMGKEGQLNSCTISEFEKWMNKLTRRVYV